MKFKVKNYKVFLFFFIFISAVCVFSNLLVYGGKNSELKSKMNLASKQEGKTDNGGLKKSLDDLLNNISEDISEDSLDILLNIADGVESKEDYLTSILDDINQKKQNLKEFKDKIKLCSKIMKEERTFVTVKNIKNLIAVGDLHGDARSTKIYIKGIKKLFESNKLEYVIFLGDYIDRGPDSIKVLDEVIDLKLQYPNKVTLLRGNHETKCIFNLFYLQDENSLINQIRRKYYPISNECTYKLRKALLEWFDMLPLAADIEIDSPDLKPPKKILAVHGGIPCTRCSECIDNKLIWENFMSLKDTNERSPVEVLGNPYLIGTQILWNDFNCDEDTGENTFNFERASGRIISRITLENFCKFYGYDFLIRGHTFYGISSIHNLINRCYTIFSASNYLGSGNSGCVAYFDYDKIGKVC